MPIIQESLSKAVFVETFENVLVEKIPEDVDDFVQDFIEFNFLDRFEVLLEHFVKIEHKSLGSPVVLIDYVFEGEFDRQLDLGILLHGFYSNLHDAVPKLDQLADEVFVLDLLVTHQFVPLLDDEF